jgi:hypothetical protein
MGKGHARNEDIYLNKGGVNEVSAEQLKELLLIQNSEACIIANIQAKLQLPYTVLHTNTDPASLNTVIQTLVDGDVLEVNSSAVYNPISIPANKELVIRPTLGKCINLTGTGCIKLMNGTRDTVIAGVSIQNCTTVNVNYQGAGITFGEIHTKVSNISFYDISIDTVLAGSGVMLSYHWSEGGDDYATPNTLSECSSQVRFINCCFYKANKDNTEGAALALRGIIGSFIVSCHFRDDTLSMRQLQLQNCISSYVSENNIRNTAIAGTNSEGIKLDDLGGCTYRSTGYILNNTIKNAVEGIDIDDLVDALVFDNICYECTEEGISVDDSATAVIGRNLCYNCRYDANSAGIRVESGAVVSMNQNNCVNNIINYRIQNGYVLPAGNSSSVDDIILKDSAKNLVYSGTIATAFNVKDAIDTLNTNSHAPNTDTTLIQGDTSIQTTDSGIGFIKFLVDNSEVMRIVNNKVSIGTTILDQQHATWISNHHIYYQNDEHYNWAAQTFKVGQTGFLSKVTVKIYQQDTPTLPIIMELRTIGSGNKPTDIVLGSVTLPANQIPTWVDIGEDVIETDFVFASPIAITAGTSYAIVCRTLDTHGYHVKIDGYNVNPNEEFFSQSSSTGLWVLVWEGDVLYFKTYIQSYGDLEVDGNIKGSGTLEIAEEIITNYLKIQGSDGTLELAGATANYLDTFVQTPSSNTLISNNLKFDGSVFKYHKNGAGVQLQMYGVDGFLNVLTVPVGVAGATAPIDANHVRFHIENNGNVGIGTATPKSQLQIGLKTQLMEQGTSNLSIFSSNAYFDGANWRYNVDGYAELISMGLSGGVYIQTAVSGLADAVATFDASSVKLTVLNDGKTGIGTMTPDSALNVVATTITSLTLNQKSAGSGNDVYFIHDENTKKAVISFRQNNDGNALAFYTYDGSNWKEGMRITQDGYVGIGTTAPCQKLDVNGALILRSKAAEGLQFTGSLLSLYYQQGTDEAVITSFDTSPSTFAYRPMGIYGSVVTLHGSVSIILDSNGNPVTIGGNIFPGSNDTYYIGKNSISTPLAYKGLILKDTANGNYYRIEVTNGLVVATQII